MSRMPVIKIYHSSENLAVAAAAEFRQLAESAIARRGQFSVALSGGRTPERFLRQLAEPIDIVWEKVHFFWSDERCVPPDHADSNYGMANRTLFRKIKIPPQNIHRIRGEAEAHAEAKRYEAEIRRQLSVPGNAVPEFDLILLGLGMDGHTASLFPGQETPGILDRLCAVGRHPQTGQLRVTITLPLINAAREVLFLIAGESKAEIVARILHRQPESADYPAAQVAPIPGIYFWYLDRASARLI